LRELVKQGVKQAATRLAGLDVRLRLLGPEQVLARGYSITMDATSRKVLRDAAQIKRGQRLKTRLHAGEVQSIAESGAQQG
jgi:exodeoxyribonuclease VII large subunit